MNPAELFRQETDTVQLAPGDFLFREGEKGEKMYVLLEGEIEIFLGDFVFETAGPGALIGEMALIDDSSAHRQCRREDSRQAGANRPAAVSFSRSADAAFCDARDENAGRSPASHECCDGCAIASLERDTALLFRSSARGVIFSECEASRSICFLLRSLRPVADNRSRRLPISQRSGSGWLSNS